MADWPLLQGSHWNMNGAAAASSALTNVTASGTVNTKGSWVQLVASTAFHSTAVGLQFKTPGTASNQLLDIGVGAASSETVLIPDVLVGMPANVGYWLWFPVGIPAGTRVAARVQSSTASMVTTVGFQAMASGFVPSSPLGGCTTYGAATADSGGTSVDPGGTANTKGSWTQLAASTTGVTRAVVLALGNQANTTRTAADQLFDLGVGAAASEQVVVADVYSRQNTAGNFFPPMAGPFFVDVPEGSRLSVRMQSSITDATDRLIDVALHCLG